MRSPVSLVSGATVALLIPLVSAQCASLVSVWQGATVAAVPWPAAPAATGCCAFNASGVAITCDTASNLITAIQFSGVALSGALPAFTEFTALTSLDLSNNAFTGSIPAALLRPALALLDISNNRLSGAIPSGTTLVFAADGCDIEGNPALCIPPVGTAALGSTCTGYAALLPCAASATALATTSTTITLLPSESSVPSAAAVATTSVSSPAPVGPADSSSSSSSPNLPVIIGASVGGAAFLVLALVAGFVFKRQRQKANEKPLGPLRTVRQFRENPSLEGAIPVASGNISPRQQRAAQASFMNSVPNHHAVAYHAQGGSSGAAKN
ncbi:hypothetical protein BJ742DRAFT_29267 [Cladochytrium replicatum]|nr:hypothetical protein BJ742DRAFT_29267 [Cladochytrium replicatum]